MRIRSSKYAVMTVLLVAALLTAVACVEEPMPVPNSDRGHLFVDLADAFAVGWQSEVLILGPATGDQYCEESMGCYSDHLPIEMEEVISTDPSVVEITGFEADFYGEVEVIRVDLEIIADGEASLEFAFTVDGYEGAEDDYDDQGRLFDSFGVSAREASSVQLVRNLDGIQPSSPYAQCPASGLGTYLMDSPSSYAVALQMQKLDSEGNLLRGTGQFPFEIAPEDAVDIVDFDEALHRVTIQPNQFGTVTITPEMDGEPFEAHFASVSAVSEMDVTLHQLNEEGHRATAATMMVTDWPYEVETLPAVSDDAPLCGGATTSSVESMSPAICDVEGFMEDTGNPAVVGRHFGECHLRITLDSVHGGQGIVQDYIYPVQSDW